MKFKYPKLTLFVIMIILAYLIFRDQRVSDIISNLDLLNKFGSFAAGIFYSFGFTGPFAAGFFLALKPNNIFLTGMLGGLGAMVSDLIIFRFVKVSFADEFRKLKDEKISKSLGKIIKRHLGRKIRKFFLYLFTIILIASPLPDETGITLLAGLTKIKGITIAAIGFVLNTLGILTLLLIGKFA